MRDNDEKELFKKLSQGTISDDELGHLNKWMSNKGVEGLSKMMDEDWSTFKESERLENSPKWMAAGKGEAKSTIKPFGKQYWAIAASILLLITLASGIIFNWMNPAKPQWVEQSNTTSRKQLIELPDGSLVWLKRKATIAYNKPFTAKERTVSLDGEAYFEVVPDVKKPFVVQSDFFKIEVLGTSFNLIADQEQKTSEVALVEGSVKVTLNEEATTADPVTLKPGEKARLNTNENQIIKSSFLNERFDDAPYGWKDDVIIFQKANVEEVANTLKDWYNIEITIDHENLVSAPLVHRVDTKKYEINQVLEGISRVMPYKFERKEDHSFIIKPK